MSARKQAKAVKAQASKKVEKKAAPLDIKINTHLLDPQFKLRADGKVESITGTCSEPDCKNKRTIHLADAFQVRRCVSCQKAAVSKKLSEKRRAKRQAARAAQLAREAKKHAVGQPAKPKAK